MTRLLGVVVNPVAGLGGPAGLKGSDGVPTQAEALARGATPRAGARAAAALAVVAREHPTARVATVAGAMGADSVYAAGLTAIVVGPRVVDGPTTADDTRAAVEALRGAGADLVLFVGGDGTARDVVDASGDGPVLGIPAGVKMYSACFAVSPVSAGAIASSWLSGATLALEPREVLDVTEDEVRAGRVDPRLHGSLVVPVVRGRTQSRKTATTAGPAVVAAAAAGVVDQLRPGVAYLLGPGSTVAEVACQLGVPKTPLGVDVVRDGRLVLADAGEQQLLDIVSSGPARAVVTVIGGQGFLLGRGNQQLSAAVVRALGDQPLLVVATEEKLTDLGGEPLVVDTGDVTVDRSLAGYVPVITGPGRHSLYPVTAPEQQGVPQCV